RRWAALWLLRRCAEGKPAQDMICRRFRELLGREIARSAFQQSREVLVRRALVLVVLAGPDRDAVSDPDQLNDKPHFRGILRAIQSDFASGALFVDSNFSHENRPRPELLSNRFDLGHR